MAPWWEDDDWHDNDWETAWERIPDKPPKTWTTQTGETLKIKKMQTPHILNAMAMLYRGGHRDGTYFEAFKKELVKRDFA